MHVLRPDGSWLTDLLDPHVPPDSCRVEVLHQVALHAADDQFFVRPRDLAMVMSYVRELGPTRVLRKVRSRSSEATRNDAWSSVGLGRVVGSDPRPVAFIAPSGPRGAERLVVPCDLVRDLPASSLDGVGVLHAVAADPGVASILSGAAAQALSALTGWQRDAGPLPPFDEQIWEELVEVALSPPRAWRTARARPPASPVRERSAWPPEGTADPTRLDFHLFGYGQYAKTQVLPNLGRRLHLSGVHEIDPAQIGPVDRNSEVVWDTSPRPRQGEAVDVAAVAGFHHTHAPLAAELIRRGARHVVVEKPLATSEDQLDDLIEALTSNPEARIHGAFQRRFSPFNPLVREDLGGGPLSFAAVVYEVPLPARHWYLWPVSGGPIVSNGCHWIDHFLWLNEFSEPVRLGVEVLSDQAVISLELASGASASISLRHRGAPRLGVRDTVTIWTQSAHATIVDNSHYVAERDFRVVRRADVHRYRSHEDMYREIGQRIVNDQPGDELGSIEVSTRTVLRLAALSREA